MIYLFLYLNWNQGPKWRFMRFNLVAYEEKSNASSHPNPIYQSVSNQKIISKILPERADFPLSNDIFIWIFKLKSRPKMAVYAIQPGLLWGKVGAPRRIQTRFTAQFQTRKLFQKYCRKEQIFLFLMIYSFGYLNWNQGPKWRFMRFNLVTYEEKSNASSHSNAIYQSVSNHKIISKILPERANCPLSNDIQL